MLNESHRHADQFGTVIFQMYKNQADEQKQEQNFDENVIEYRIVRKLEHTKTEV